MPWIQFERSGKSTFYNLPITEAAEEDLDNIVMYISSELSNPSTCQIFSGSVVKCYRIIQNSPLAYAECTDNMLHHQIPDAINRFKSSNFLIEDCQDCEEPSENFVMSLDLSARATNILKQMNILTSDQFLRLDERRLLKQRNCGKKTIAEIMTLIKLHRNMVIKNSCTNAVNSLSKHYNEPIDRLGLSVRSTNALKGKNIIKIGQLLNISNDKLLGIRNFGKTSLQEVRDKLLYFCSNAVLWPDSKRSKEDLNSRITYEAKRLLKFRSAIQIFPEDPRFGHLIRATGLDVENLREAAIIIVSRQNDPINPSVLVKLLNSLNKEVQKACHMSIEEELLSLTEGRGNDRNRMIFASYMGWAGQPSKTLEEVGQAYNMTRERVRQICNRISSQIAANPFLPALDRAIRIILDFIPAPASDIENIFVQQRVTKSLFHVESVLSTAYFFGKDTKIEVKRLNGVRFVVMATHLEAVKKMFQVVRIKTTRWGVASIDDIASSSSLECSFIVKVLTCLPGFNWLEESSGWFWISEVPQNSLLTQIRKILAASSEVTISELRSSVSRHHRRKGFAPPSRILLELCKQLPWCKVQDNTISSSVFLNPREELNETENIIFEALKKHGPLMSRPELEKRCLNAGVNPNSFWTCLSYCPIVTKFAAGVYGLIGAQVPTGVIEKLVPKQPGQTRVLVDYKWTGDGKILLIYRISAGMLSSGIVSIPKALNDFLNDKYTTTSENAAGISEYITICNGSINGLRILFRRSGGEEGDYLSLIFNISQRSVEIQIGNEEILSEFEED